MDIKKLFVVILIGTGIYLIIKRKGIFVEKKEEIVRVNLLKNGSFESWLAGLTSAPDGWASGGKIERTSTNKKIGAYGALLIDPVGGGTPLVQHYVDTTGGRIFTMTVWAKTSVADNARVYITGPTKGSWSSFHTGSGNWELLKATITLPIGDAYLDCHLYALKANAEVIWDDAILIEEKS